MIGDPIDNVRCIVRVAKGFAQSLRSRVDAHQISREQAVATFRDDLHGCDLVKTIAAASRPWMAWSR
jgi:hypothetical protein